MGADTIQMSVSGLSFNNSSCWTGNMKKTPTLFPSSCHHSQHTLALKEHIECSYSLFKKIKLLLTSKLMGITVTCCCLYIYIKLNFYQSPLCHAPPPHQSMHHPFMAHVPYDSSGPTTPLPLHLLLLFHGLSTHTYRHTHTCPLFHTQI